MTQRHRIVLAEDHTIVREGLKALLSSHPDYEVVGEAADGREAIRLVDDLKPDLVLMDLSMPRTNGIEAVREIKRRHKETRIIALTVHKDEEYILSTLQAGADGYVLKDVTHSELLIAIDHILRGQTYLSAGISGRVIEGYLAGKAASPTRSAWEALTQREREILKLIGEG